ncbi:hypothetical protein ACQ4LE_002943 [Meloidogyne hapla]
MVGLHPTDREFAKFLWVKDLTKPPEGENIQFYRFARVAFGVICSPYLLAGVIRYHLDKYGQGVASELANSLYVDNLHLGAETWPELLDKCLRAKEIFSDARMNLREFSSNSSEMMKAIPEKDRLESQEPKVLGMRWNIQDDFLSFLLPKEGIKKRSRRDVLSSLAGIYDPLGLLSPSVLQAKLFFQKLWDEGRDWDSPLSEEESSIWENFLKGWQDSNISLPRRALSTSPDEIELHTFVDASSCAYAAAVYLRGVNKTTVSTSLIFSKNRLKPKKGGKTLTIPRMELIAILIGVRATSYIQKEIGVPLTEIHLWSDSQIALSWVKSFQSQPTFVQRRLDEIKKHVNITFHYVRTDENPSDLATRGLTPQELNQSRLWWSGPDWLGQSKANWPEDPTFDSFNLTEVVEDESEEKYRDQILSLPAQGTSRESHKILMLSSSWAKSRRIMVYILRFSKLVLRKEGAPKFGINLISENGPLTAADITLAEIYLIRWEQKECLEELKKYKHIVDDQSIIRLQTRMTNSQGPEGLIHPILLPKNSDVGKLLIAHIHKRLCHGGVDWTLTEYLTRYWQPRARQTVRRVISECMACRKMNSYKYALPQMPPLPNDRVQQRRPFQSIGVDYAGPTLTKLNGALIKCWLVLITCLTTRAVYLEPTLDLTAASFINVFRRFISRRGRPERVLSDNGRNFVLAEKAISSALAPLLAENKIEWKFIPALSPWAGGVYERLIGLAKSCFKRTLGKQILPYDQLSTFIAEVEAALNSRPLTHVSDGEGAPLALRPIDFIHPGSVLNCEPAGKKSGRVDHLPPQEQLLAHWKGTLENLDSLWERRKREYLVMLRDNSKWEHKGPRLQSNSPPKVGDVVLVEEAMQPRNTWTLARVEKLNGDLGPIRSVKLRMPNGRITTRPVNRIYPLEVGIEPTDQINQPPEQENNPPETVRGEEVDKTRNEPVKSTLNLPPFEEEAEEDPPPFIEKQNKIVKENIPHTRRVESKHGMATRSKVTVAAAIPLVIFLALTLFPFLVYASNIKCIGCPKCQGCTVHCNKFGVRILAPEKISKIQICCSDHCHLFPGQPETDHILSKEVLLNDYECKANFWDTNRENPFEVFAHCSALHPCQLINCNFCLDLLLNPSCRPKMAAFVLCCVLFPFIVLLSCICGAMQRILRPFGFILKFCNPMSRQQRVYVKNINREIVGKGRTALGKLTTKATKEAKKKGREIRQASLVRLARYGILSILISLTILLASSDTVSVISQSESCRVKNGTRHCRVTSATTLSLLPAGQPNNLLIKDKRGEVLGALTLTLRSLTLVCNPKTVAYLRSYQINTRSVWRCPTSGSCSGSFCSLVGPKTHIPELAEVMSNVGTSGCIESSAVWSKGCGLPTASCYFYRWYAVPMSFDVYELFECPTWDFHINSNLILTVNDYSKEESLTLIPGWTQHSNNISLTPIANSNPPAPILGTPFLTHGFSVDLASVRGFGCNISEEACKECRPTSGDTVTCQCREFDAEAILADPELRLPLTIGRHTFLTEDDSVYVEQTYTPIQIHIQMENLQLVTQITESTCKISPKEIRGCYKCMKGVQVDFTCTTDSENALAYIWCADGINFIARCSENGTSGTAAFTYDRSRIDTSCITKCPGGESTFYLKGELIFIPLAWKEREDIQSMASQKSAAWTFGSFSPLYLFPSLPIGFSISLFFVLITLLIFFYIFLRLKLKFFRKVATSQFLFTFWPAGKGLHAH